MRQLVVELVGSVLLQNQPSQTQNRTLQDLLLAGLLQLRLEVQVRPRQARTGEHARKPAAPQEEMQWLLGQGGLQLRGQVPVRSSRRQN